MTIKEILIKAKALISKPENWCKHAFAQDNDGLTTTTFAHNATRFCAMGALRRVEDQPQITRFDRDRCELALRHAIGISDIATFNDSADTDHNAVMDMYDKAIANFKE